MNNINQEIENILSGDIGDLRLSVIPYTKCLCVSGGFIGYGRKSSEKIHYKVNKVIVSGKGIKAFICKGGIVKAGFAGIRESEGMTVKERERFELEKAMVKPRFHNAFKNYEVFSSRAFSVFKKKFNPDDLIKVVALLRLYNELYLKGDKVGCRLIKSAVKGLQVAIK